MHLVLDRPDAVAAFVGARIPQVRDFGGFATGIAVGVADADERLVGGFVAEAKTAFESELSVAFDTPRAASPALLREAARLAFRELGILRLVMRTAVPNTRARRLATGLGFREIGKGRRALDGKHSAVLYEMTLDDYERSILHG